MKHFLFFFCCLSLLIGAEEMESPLPEVFPSFDNAMQPDKLYFQSVIERPRQWAVLRELYCEYLAKNMTLAPDNASYKIPKIIHMIWLGSPLPDFAKRMIASWKELHPTWEIRLWTDAELINFPLINQEAFDRTKNFGKKSDIWRYEILERFGGMYADCDFECIRSFDEIHQTADFYTGIGDGRGKPKFLNGIIGCRPHHPIMQLCVESIKPDVVEDSFQEILHATGPVFFTNCVERWLKERGNDLQENESDIVVVFPATFFYPFPDYLRSSYSSIERVKRDWLRPETFAIHYWAISWLPEKPLPPPEDIVSTGETG